MPDAQSVPIQSTLAAHLEKIDQGGQDVKYRNYLIGPHLACRQVRESGVAL